MDTATEKLQIALVAAVLTFSFGVLLLMVREWLERRRESQKKLEELLALLDLYVAEIATAFERCVQYVRQYCMNEVSRSKLSILVGPDKLDRVAALGGSSESVRALHGIYRLYDLVENQVEKRTAEDFFAINAFVIGSLPDVTSGYRFLHDYIGHLRHPESPGRRLLGKLIKWIRRANSEFLFGGPNAESNGPRLMEMKAIEERFRSAEEELGDWVVAQTHVKYLAFGDQVAYDMILGFVKKDMAQRRARTLRTLVGLLLRWAANRRSRRPVAGLNWERLFRTGYEVADVPDPGGPYGLEQLESAIAAWSSYWLKHDPQSYDA